MTFKNLALIPIVRIVGRKQEGGVNCLWNIFAKVECRLKANEESKK